jgi:[acyl-carrier-protein] S-malonyltransferase
MSKLACVFPGQGSQSVGMGKAFFDEFELAQKTFAEIDQAAGRSLSTLCFEGPEAELKRTINTQPTILAASLAAWVCYKALNGPAPDFVAGHSLGEITALAVSEALTFPEAVKLVERRAALMESCPQGAMTAVLAMSKEELGKVCEETRALLLGQGATELEATVVIANFNTREQLVISGNPQAVARAGALVKERGGKAIALPVGGAFHSPLMSFAAGEFALALDACAFQDARFPVVQNVDALSKTAGVELKQTLAKQMKSPVRWVEIVEYLAGQGVDTIIEIGPGKVLTGLVKKIDRNIKVFNVFDVESLEAVIEELKAVAV